MAPAGTPVRCFGGMHGPDARERAALPPGPYLIGGLGRAGLSALEAIAGSRPEPSIVAWDGRPSPPPGTVDAARASGADLLIGDELAAEAVASGARTLVKSPGIPAAASPVRLARRLGLGVLDELELGWRLTTAPVIAVTGTNGKSTTSGLVASVLAAGGIEVALGGNVDAGPPLSRLASRSPDWIVCEVSSYQLEGAPGFLPDVAVFTNLSHDHLHRHGGMARYGSIKRRMFIRGDRCAGVSIVNVDDPFGDRLARAIEARRGAVVRFGRGSRADYRLLEASWTARESRLRLATPHGRLTVRGWLPGWHNAYNVAAALAVGDVLSLQAGTTLPAIEAFAGVPGRWHRVVGPRPFDVVIDLAHSPASVAAFMLAARRLLAARRGEGRLLVVIGAAGGRLDELKRHRIGWLIGRLADRFFLTTGDTYGAAPGPALQALARGAARAGRAQVHLERDRRAAIEQALSTARPGDIVGILGRGAMERLVLDRSGRNSTPFHDGSVAREALERVA